MRFPKQAIIGVILFLTGFEFFLYSAAPTIAPYRDAGEMATIIPTLGVAHPPGYPLYILSGNIIERLIPFGNSAYRINLASVLAMAGCIVFVYGICLRFFPGMSLWAAAGIGFLLGTGGNFRFVAQVSEMYAAHMFACAFLVWILAGYQQDAHFFRRLLVAGFLGGFLLGFRLDLILAAPAFALMAAPFFKHRRDTIISSLVKIAIFGSAGFTVYFYLQIRAGAEPLINWGNPDTFEKLMNVISRKTHGHTLDLLSVNYLTGQLFIPEITIYLKHLFWEFSPLGIPLMMTGVYGWLKKDRWIPAALIAGFVFSGPVFIFLSNMPPNPHALAIVQAHYLLPDIFAFLCACGSLHLVPHAYRKAVFAVVLVMIGINLYIFSPRSEARSNYFAYDYAKNILRSLPPGSAAVVKEDVQLFSLWYMQTIEGLRPGSPVIAHGLAGSSWYQKRMRKLYPGLGLMPLRTEENWNTFVRTHAKYRVYVSGDTPYTGSKKITVVPYGLLSELQPVEGSLQNGYLHHDRRPSNEVFLKEFMIRRGDYRYEFQAETNLNFFNADLVEEYASAWRKMGYTSMSAKKYQDARKSFFRAIYMKRVTPTPYYHLGYMYFAQEEYDLALRAFEDADARYQNFLRLTEQYYTLPDVVSGIKKEYAEVLTNYGVTYEKLNRPEQAKAQFLRALTIQPSSVQALFNIATVYWQEGNWRKVVYYLEQAAFIEPGNLSVRRYLSAAREKLQQERK